MSSVLYRLGRWAYRARRTVIAVWVAALVVLGGAAGLLNQGLDNNVTIPGTESQAALDRLAATFPQVSGTSAQVLVLAPEGVDVRDDAAQDAVADAVTAYEDVDAVSTVVSPFVEGNPDTFSDDDRAALITVQVEGEGPSIGDDVKEALSEATTELAAALPAGWDATIGGQLYANEFPGMTLTEALGVLVALVVLILTLGSFVAAGMPIVNALLGVGISTILVFLATAFTPITATTPLLSLMLGLAVGIDYALFIVSRHRDQLLTGTDAEESTARSVATAGSAVVFAGLTVMIALVGLSVAGIPFLTVMGVAGAVAVGVSVLVSLTLVPAMLGFAGERLRPGTSRRARRRAARAEAAVAAAPAPSAGTPASAAGDAESEWAELPPHHNRFFAGWVRNAARWPALTIVLVIAGVGALSLPALDLRLALPDAGSLPESNQARITYDRISDHFGPGANGPLIVTGSIVTSDDPLGLMEDIGDEIAQLDGVADVPLSTPNETADTGIVQVVPETGPTDVATADLVREIRSLQDHFLDEYGVELSVTGSTAVGIDVSDKLGAALLPFALFVVGLSLVLLTMVFRSVAVPIKATLGYLLSVGAAFGVVTMVFEHGVGADLLHVARLGPIISFMPIVLMGVLFGLAMDYEVFLVSRMREDYVHSRDALASIRTGFLGSAKVVTAAAVIMFAVFFAFVPEGDTNIKPIALGLAVGVFVDAFVVRMTLVPAVMQLLGDKAWWMPRWLDKALPSFDVEGEGLHRELSLAHWPAEGTALAARRLRLDPRAGLEGEIELAVPERGALVVDGTAPGPVSGLLLTLAGRLEPAGGDVKVAGLLLPERSAAVRRRVALVDLRTEPATALADAVAERPAVLVVDGTGALTPATRATAREALRSASAAGTTLVLGASGDVQDLLPAGVPTARITLSPAPAGASPDAPAAV